MLSLRIFYVIRDERKDVLFSRSTKYTRWSSLKTWTQTLVIFNIKDIILYS